MSASASFHALVILNLLFVTGAWCLARPSVQAAIALVVVSGMWVVGNGPIEGRVLWSYSRAHGVTESDLLSVIGVIIAAITLWRARSGGRHRRR
ncbi:MULTISPECIES: hypothetical protein [Gordonia]|jgi:hypothetical protein|uniref:Uncharacterized protein n=2 Tax=Gordonia TaxID=2053 RepID=A0A9X3I3L5_9ACTN|nr:MULTISPECIES: hypothetical protein [Gordonia]MCF3939330.1 hypothetical protein [Gordonia tangerina]MCX2963075.1 hypothetical protein [Gordonia aquimaris]